MHVCLLIWLTSSNHTHHLCHLPVRPIFVSHNFSRWFCTFDIAYTQPHRINCYRFWFGWCFGTESVCVSFCSDALWSFDIVHIWWCQIKARASQRTNDTTKMNVLLEFNVRLLYVICIYSLRVRHSYYGPSNLRNEMCGTAEIVFIQAWMRSQSGSIYWIKANKAQQRIYRVTLIERFFSLRACVTSPSLCIQSAVRCEKEKKQQQPTRNGPTF